jgi:hypothetical protein
MSRYRCCRFHVSFLPEFFHGVILGEESAVEITCATAAAQYGRIKSQQQYDGEVVRESPRDSLVPSFRPSGRVKDRFDPIYKLRVRGNVCIFCERNSLETRECVSLDQCG